VGHDVGLNLFIFFYRKLMTTRNAARKTPSWKCSTLAVFVPSGCRYFTKSATGRSVFRLFWYQVIDLFPVRAF
jgi:hypothetical protein